MSFDVLVVIVILNAIATITLWRTAAPRPEKLKKKFFAALMDNKPIVPRHQRPTIIGEDWGVDDHDREFFADFEDFADVVNWWFADPDLKHQPWRLQELADTELRLGFHDAPTYGRRYDIYHNQVRVGTLELQASYHYQQGKEVIANIEVEWVRLLHSSTIRDLLGVIALHICDPAPSSEGYRQAQAAITNCLINTLWQMQRITRYDRHDDSPDYGELSLRLDGAAEFYFDRRNTEVFTEQKKQRVRST
jgi:hypothetical protein